MANGLLFRINHAEILGVISALLILIGAFLPWATASTIFGSVSVSGIDRDGMITFILSVMAIGVIYYGRQRLKRKNSGVGLLIVGFIIVIIALVDGVGVAEISKDIDIAYIQIGIGLYLTGIGGFGLIISGIWNSSKKEEIVLICEKCGKQGNITEIKECSSDIPEWQGKYVCKPCYEELKKPLKDTW